MEKMCTKKAERETDKLHAINRVFAIQITDRACGGKKKKERLEEG